MKRTILVLSLICYALGASGQEFSVPKGYKFAKADDYVKHEADIVKCFDWLMATPANEQTTNREKASKYLTEWLMGSPSVSITINQEIVNFMQPNPDLLMVFMGGYAKDALSHKDSPDSKAGNLKGLEAVIEYYQKNKDYLQKDKNVEKYIKLQGKGKLKDFVAKNG